MIKGIKKGFGPKARRLNFDEKLTVPIIENTNREEELKESMAEAMEKYPEACAVLVRRHGVYVWGDSWVEAKTMCECFDYLFSIAVKMHRCGIDFSKTPEELDCGCSSE
eukprot:TRINITY_DN1648_c0_g1_i1.p1 TRINITY_DN1648_c0_g1~~TRINITY_DN1648_c0_g1_i1.p1  ORF type:complete len:109 (+),score=11.78 TRINITY_DN1648_c0_g1_i1:492-818(+)